MQSREGPILPSDNAARIGVAGATAGSIANMDRLPTNPGQRQLVRPVAQVRGQPPQEGGANARDEEIARLQLENHRTKIRLEVQAEERQRRGYNGRGANTEAEV